MNTLYRFYDKDDTLLYVGLTVNPGRRMEKHRGTKDWWKDVARIEMEQHESLAALRAAEKTAIQAESPLYNIRLRGQPQTADRVAVLQEHGWQRISARGAQSWTHPDHPGCTFTLSAAVGHDTKPDLEPPQIVQPEPQGIVGRWFHSWEQDDDGRRTPGWQGQIIERDESGVLIVQLYSWWDGFPSDKKIVDLATITEWTLYDSAQDMQIALGCNEDFGNGRSGERSGRCQSPVTHVIRSWHDLGPIYRCEDCIKFYSGKVEAL